MARQGRLALLGPNTIGYFNFVDSFHVMMVDLKAAPALAADSGPALAVVAQSGGIGAHICGSLQSRAVPITYMMTTGNEALLNVADMISFLADDERTAVIAVYAEQIVSAQQFLEAARKARAHGKRIVLLHPGRSEKGQAAASSHTGALATNHGAMDLIAQQAGVAVVQTLEELIDLGQLLLHFPDPGPGGLGILTGSGALCVLTQDYIAALEMDIPALSARSVSRLRSVLPEYLTPRNPLDVGTLIGWKPELVGIAAQEILADPSIGNLLVSLPMADPAMSIAWMEAYLPAYRASRKPAVYVIHCEDRPLAPQLVKLIQENRVIVMRSHERALRALARFSGLGETWRTLSDSSEPEPFATLPQFGGAGPVPEWLGKKTLAAMGIKVPNGALATTPDEAARIASRVGFPVVLKAQAAELAHKSEAGGVILNIADEAQLRDAWVTLHQNVMRAKPGLRLEGVLIETMCTGGVELLVGATRDPNWGPILMVGLGGIWVEALGDVRLLLPNPPPSDIVRQLRKLKASKLLAGFRGSNGVDVEAVADVVSRVGRLMLTQPTVKEVDINPLIAYPPGHGVIALDALIVTR
jgi:acyl-CoA synthetase (NDP forming)